MAPDLSHLIKQAKRHIYGSGAQPTALESLKIFSRSFATACDATIYKPSLIVTLQAEKQLYLGKQKISFTPGDCLITAVDMPIVSNIIGATKATPYISVIFELDTEAVAELAADLGNSSSNDLIPQSSRAISTTSATHDILDIIQRALNLLDAPQDIPVIYPMLKRELIYRLLVSEQGQRLRHCCILDSSSHKIAQAITHLNQNFRETIRIETLAKSVNMSVSSMHSHFKAVTTLTPLQYQKQLRLYAARRLIISSTDVASSAYQVGYESASQFSRDYSKLFGLPPSQDRIRQQSEATQS